MIDDFVFLPSLEIVFHFDSFEEYFDYDIWMDNQPQDESELFIDMDKLGKYIVIQTDI